MYILKMMTQMYLNGLGKVASKNSEVRAGRLCFKNTRIPIDYVLMHFSKGWSLDEISELFPDVKKDDIIYVQNYASSNINDKARNPRPSSGR